jgi:type IV secretion system protein TrbG
VTKKITMPFLWVALTILASVTIGVLTLDAQTATQSAPTTASATPGEQAAPAVAGTETGQAGTVAGAQQKEPSVVILTPPAPENTAPTVVHRDPPPPAERLAPQDFVEKKTVVMPITGERALKASGAWDATVNPAAMGKDGRVVFTYGAGMPVLVCAPLRICVIELERGEHVASAPYIGDSVRWDVSLETLGSGDQDTPLIILKPRDTGLDTSLFLATDRRSYYMRLISKTGPYTPMVAFEYPEDNEARLQEVVRQEQIRKETQITPVANPIDSIFYGYEIKGDGPFRPIRVMDDGSKTYIQMSPENVHRELPSLVVEGPGGRELVNFRVKDNYYIVDRIFDRAALLLGSGKHIQKVEIIREGKLAHQPGKSNPAGGTIPEGSN